MNSLFPILKKVARSFYLTIRLLPKKLQEPVALAYLLARASDTIADEATASFRRSECDLLKLLPSLLEKLNDPSRDPVEAMAIRVVWQTILEGQQWDMEKFSPCRSSMILSSEELSRYLYLVAGCVGEFWTTLGAHHRPGFSKESFEKMRIWAIDYGKGLQLTNILRDRYEDRENGRFYCSEDQFSQLQEQALDYLQQGRRYIEALRPGRFKMASALPLMLAVKTLSLVDRNRNAAKVKVSRGSLYLTLLQSSLLLLR
ncbi:MAG: squalene/phytoene synthase family protein [Chthoniobacterales bacterium]|nr:squalene/phytoene synthase family protein [Chthoniobacterales bacterium]